ncbi:myogenesis-regulating glycosidase [Condylostylus longicornis]|uniref:myogenesis-regulating glycosidase n=1 Tax=Condylostylus longicornis TaxID=2530218 RepID=UPI00244E2895|nr:myogenesis-regulating glycosidase [Condylostylus longicornis]
MITEKGKVLQSVLIDNGYKNGKFEVDSSGVINLIASKSTSAPSISFELEKENNFYKIRVSRNVKGEQTVKDCVDLEIGKTFWYGGPQNRFQYWPIERANFTNFSYVSKEELNSAVPERYWLNSRGVFFYINETVPLFIDQNSVETEVNETNVKDYANKIISNQFNNSQFEIDDDWEDCYGALTFRKNKFPDIKKLTDWLKEKGFRVTLWIHPFINTNCTEIFNIAKSKKYLVTDDKGEVLTKWWNSKPNEAAYIDFTNPEAAEWFYNRVKRLRDQDGIDSFKFDAGETSWIPKNSKLTGPANQSPNLILAKYIETVSKFGKIVEVRSAQGTQSYPIFLRMIDKDTDWTWNNGLPTLITTLFQLNLGGYSFILPDMIGGNGYNNNTPDKEIFIRWLQANVFMPSLQFSYVPWMYDAETINISLKYTKLHDNITNYIMERFQKVVETGEPTNPPLWWIDPEDIIAQQITDQFLLGDKYVVAPVIVKGARVRDIYLPKGTWRDGNTNDIHIGPKWIMNYPAPIATLPYFERTN